jgi:hypothetical protein
MLPNLVDMWKSPHMVAGSSLYPRMYADWDGPSLWMISPTARSIHMVQAFMAFVFGLPDGQSLVLRAKDRTPFLQSLA